MSGVVVFAVMVAETGVYIGPWDRRNRPLEELSV